MSFKDYLKLKEVATTTASVATFARPIGMVRRSWPVLGGTDPFVSVMSFDDDKKKKKKKKKKS